MTIRVLRYILIYSISIVLFECSFDNKTGIWENKQKRKTANTKLIKLSNNQEKVQTEINPALAININSEARINDNWIMSGLNYSNQIYHLNFDGKISKFSKYKLKKIKHNQIKETPLIVGENYFITIDEEGSILKFMNRGKFHWSKNVYSKKEKKKVESISLALHEDKLYAMDNLGKYYSLNVDNG